MRNHMGVSGQRTPVFSGLRFFAIGILLVKAANHTNRSALLAACQEGFNR